MRCSLAGLTVLLCPNRGTLVSCTNMVRSVPSRSCRCATRYWSLLRSVACAARCAPLLVHTLVAPAAMQQLPRSPPGSHRGYACGRCSNDHQVSLNALRDICSAKAPHSPLLSSDSAKSHCNSLELHRLMRLHRRLSHNAPTVADSGAINRCPAQGSPTATAWLALYSL